jgi:hypothetical protein
MLSVFKRLPRAQALKLARQALREGTVTPTSHYERERDKENLTDQDARHAVDHGSVHDEPEPHPKTGNWTYRIKGPVLDGRNVVVVVAFESEKHITVLTVFIV